MIIMQFIQLLSKYFREAHIPLQLTSFQIEILSDEIALIEQLQNVISFSELNCKIKGKMNINTFFRNFFCNNFEEAQKNLVESLAAYCLVAYLLNSQEKIFDHIMLDVSGKVIMKKFGNCLVPSNSNYSMFKLHQEFVEIMDGYNSAMFQYFKSLLLRGLIEVKKHISVLSKLIEIQLKSLKISGFSTKDKKIVINSMIERFLLTTSDVDLFLKIEEMMS